LKTTSDWKAFFYKFYEQEIYPGALSLKFKIKININMLWIKFFVSFNVFYRFAVLFFEILDIIYSWSL